MAPIHNPEDTAAAQRASAGDFGEAACHRPSFRSQANAPCLQRPGRSYFR